MNRIAWVLVYALAGGVIFWLPDIVIHAVRQKNFSGLDILILTFILPLLTIVGFAVLWNLRRGMDSRAFIALSMLLGIWVLGPLFMAIGWNFMGGGLAKPGGWKLVVKGTLLFPVFTFIESTYDGTLFAVLLTTFCLGLVAIGRPSWLFARFT